LLTESVNDINTALDTMRRLGLSDQASTLINQAGETAAATYSRLDADQTHSDSWKLGAYADAYINTMSGLARTLTTAAAIGGKEDQADAARVFGIKGLPGDVASLTISRRDAGDRIADISDSTQMQRLLDQAVRNGDDVLAHAIVEKAITTGTGDSAVTESFMSAYPDLSDAVQRLWTAQHHSLNSLDITTAWQVAALKPAALKSRLDYEIQTIAAGQRQ
jgi:hypothetical protein